MAGLLKPKKRSGGLKPPGSKVRQKRGLAKLPTKPYGQKLLKLFKEPEEQTGPGEPPEGFVGVWSSKTEWYVYWALMKLTEPERDPRQPPFIGGQFFVFQKAEGGARVPGGSVTDFAVSTPTGWIGIRVETERWHIWTAAEVQMKDFYIKTHLQTMQAVISLWDQHFMFDPSGKAVLRVVGLALKLVELPSPIRFGNAERVRP